MPAVSRTSPRPTHRRPTHRRPSRRARPLYWLLGALLAWSAPVLADEESILARDARLIDAAIAAMPAPQPGQPDLYVIGFAGDGQETVFANEVRYLHNLMASRFQAPRMLGLINHPDSLDAATAAPLATQENLRRALAGVGAAMDPDEDLLLLFITTHGGADHTLAVELPPLVDESLQPAKLRAMLDASGIRNRVVVVSACYGGGFLAPLRSPDSLIITAARHDRTSFGCGAASHITYFGQAWLVDGLNQHTDFVAAFNAAREQIHRQERANDLTPSLPQLEQGTRIGRVLDAWQAGLVPGPAVPYPYGAATGP